MSHTSKVVSISKGATKNARTSDAVRDGWGAPKNGPQLAIPPTDPSEEPRDAA